MNLLEQLTIRDLDEVTGETVHFSDYTFWAIIIKLETRGCERKYATNNKLKWRFVYKKKKNYFLQNYMLKVTFAYNYLCALEYRYKWL